MNNTVINKLNKYMITDSLIKEVKKSNQSFSFENLQKQSYSKRDASTLKTVIESNEIYDDSDKSVNKVKETIFYPKEKDSLFWSFYVMLNGISKYEMIQYRNLIVEKKFKYEFIEKIRQNKDALKVYKFASIQHLENVLANEHKIDVKTFLALCVIENINVFYMKNKIFYQHLMNDSDVIYQIYHLDGDKFGFKISKLNECETFKNTLYQVDNIDKPIKSAASYKVQELVQICEKLGIETVDKETSKTKTKNKLYESIVLYF